MGWCSATEIMDTALAAAETTVVGVLDDLGFQGHPIDRSRMDDHLRTFVRAIAEHLRQADWDCIEESAYFERFPQEMLGYGNDRYLSYLHDRLKDTEPGEHDFPIYVRKLGELLARMEKTS